MPDVALPIRKICPSSSIQMLLGSGLAWGIIGIGMAQATPLDHPVPLHPPIHTAIAAPAIAPHVISDPMLFLPEVAEQASRLVLRLSERRLYVYQGEHEIARYPVAIGRDNWETPTGQFSVFQRQQHPAWQHPFTGAIVPPGPNNPLGARWLGFWTDGTNFIGFHGTPNEQSIGRAISHGCVRLRNADVIELYAQVALGTPVIVVP